MRIAITIGVSAITSLVTLYVFSIVSPHLFGASITTINGTDRITDSRSVINTNFSNLNNAITNATSTEPSMAKYFVATSTDKASVLPYASTTALTVSGAGFFGGATSFGGTVTVTTTNTATSTLVAGCFQLSATSTGSRPLKLVPSSYSTTTATFGQGTVGFPMVAVFGTCP